MDGLSLTASWAPQGSTTPSKTGFGVNYTGMEGLTVKYAVADVVKVLLKQKMVTLQY